MDNPITTSSPSSCAYEDGNYNLINFSGQYLVIDNLEILGYCWNITNPWNEVVNINANDEMKNSYWHGWTMGKTATGCGSCDSDEYWAINSPNSLSQYSRMDHNVFDGSDSTYGNLFGSYGDATGGIFRGGGEADHNVLNHCSNGVKYTLMYIFHDNYLNLHVRTSSGWHSWKHLRAASYHLVKRFVLLQQYRSLQQHRRDGGLLSGKFVVQQGGLYFQ